MRRGWGGGWEGEEDRGEEGWGLGRGGNRGVIIIIYNSRDLWLLGCGSSGVHFSAGCPSGIAVAVEQVKGHYKHLPKTEPHPRSLQCQSLAIPC